MYKFPFQVDIDVTNACNYDCIYCCADAKHKFDDELTLAEIKMLVDELYNVGGYGYNICRRRTIFA